MLMLTTAAARPSAHLPWEPVRLGPLRSGAVRSHCWPGCLLELAARVDARPERRAPAHVALVARARSVVRGRRRRGPSPRPQTGRELRREADPAAGCHLADSTVPWRSVPK